MSQPTRNNRVIGTRLASKAHRLIADALVRDTEREHGIELLGSSAEDEGPELHVVAWSAALPHRLHALVDPFHIIHVRRCMRKITNIDLLAVGIQEIGHASIELGPVAS